MRKNERILKTSIYFPVTNQINNLNYQYFKIHQNGSIELIHSLNYEIENLIYVSIQIESTFKRICYFCFFNLKNAFTSIEILLIFLLERKNF